MTPEQQLAQTVGTVVGSLIVTLAMAQAQVAQLQDQNAQLQAQLDAARAGTPT